MPEELNLEREDVRKMYKTLSAPLVAQVEISARCTSKCMHCYNHWRRDDDLKSYHHLDISEGEIDRIMDQLVHHRVLHVVFTGGEPFLNKRILFKALEKAQAYGITTGINSNLVPITTEDAMRLKQLGVTSVLTSLMGPTSEIHDELSQCRGSFKKTVKGIRFLQEVGVPVVVNMVVSQKNKQFIKETAVFVKSLGIKHFNSTRAGCPGNCSDFSEMSLNLQDFRDYLAELHDIGKQEQMSVGVLESYPLCAIKEVNCYKSFIGRRCSAAVTTLTIASDGNIRPCSHLDVAYGNIFKEDLASVWARMQEWRDGKLLPSECSSCEILAWCGGGCRMEAKMKNGSLSAIDPYMSSQDVGYTASELAKIKYQASASYSLPPMFRLNPKIRWRTEKFGAVVFMDQRFKCYLNAIATKLIQALNIDCIYQLSDFIGKFDDGVEEFLKQLYNRQILIQGGDRYARYI